MATLASFASPASAKQFLANVKLGESFDVPAIGLIRHPMSGLFAFAAAPDSEAATSNLLAKIGDVSQVQSLTSASQGTGATSGAAGAGATPAPTTIQGAADIKNQVQQDFAVGNNIISFDQGVTADRKNAAINSALLAQLWADYQNPDRTVTNYAANWYGTYFNTLINIGWILQGDGVVHTFQGTGQGTIDKDIITLASALVGANGAAAVKAVFDSLQNLASDSPVITIFKETSQTNSVAQFSISLASQDPNAGFLINGLEFDLTATGVDTQILFFHWQSQTAVFNWRSLQLTLADTVFNAIASDLAHKVASYVGNYVKEIVLPPPSLPGAPKS